MSWAMDLYGSLIADAIGLRRAIIEEEYALKLAKLAKAPIGAEETGCVRVLLAHVPCATSTDHRLHGSGK